MKNTLPSNRLFIGLLLAAVLVTAPLWIPLSMIVCLSTGRSLRDFNDEANKMSGLDAAE